MMEYCLILNACDFRKEEKTVSIRKKSEKRDIDTHTPYVIAKND